MPRQSTSSSGPSTPGRGGAEPGGSAAATIALRLVRSYQLFVRPALPASCRFAPSCSQFAVQALREHGVLRGGVLALRRIARCHPWSPGGWDPVPARRR